MRVPTWRGKKYPILRFEIVDGIHVATQPWPRAFIATREFLNEGARSGTLEIRELTLRTLIVVLVQNWISQVVWRARRGCWRLGFLDALEYRPFSEAVWRWRFWQPRAGTDPRAAPGSATAPEGLARRCEYGDKAHKATRRVHWSDREALVCEAHLLEARRAASEDGPNDRTDDPFVEVL